jgi:hypothetical protein
MLGQIACNIFIEGGKQMDANLSSPQYLSLGWPEFIGGIFFWGLNFEQSKFDQP